MPRAVLVNPSRVRPRGGQGRAGFVRSRDELATAAFDRWQDLISAANRRGRSKTGGRAGKSAALDRAKARALALYEKRARAAARARPRPRSSEAALHHMRKLGRAIGRRTAVARRRGAFSGEGANKLPPRLAALHAAYARARDVEHRRTAAELAAERRERKRRRNPMAKRRSAKQRAATRRNFLKMRAANRRRAGGHRKRSSSSSRKRHRRNPSRPRLPARSRKAVRAALTRLVPVPVAALVRTRNPHRKRKGPAMAKRRRRARRSSPPRRHRRRHHSSPRRHHRRRYRHNPGVGGAVRMLTTAALPAVAGGLGAGLLDSLLLGGRSVLVRVGGKLLAAGLGGALLRKNPMRAASFVASMIGTAAYEGGVRIAGGIVAHNKPAGMKELAGMAAEDEASLGLLQEELRGVGLLEEDTSRGMGDLEPNLGDEEPNLGDEEMADMGDEYTE